MANILSRMAYRQPKPRYEQFHVYVGLSILFQRSMGRVPSVWDMGCIFRYWRCFSCSKGGRDTEKIRLNTLAVVIAYWTGYFQTNINLIFGMGPVRFLRIKFDTPNGYSYESDFMYIPLNICVLIWVRLVQIWKPLERVTLRNIFMLSSVIIGVGPQL